MPVPENGALLQHQHEDLKDVFDWPNAAGFTASHEQHEPKKLRISGRFPSYSAGQLYRTGPGTYRVPRDNGADYECSHWFDGFSHIHKFHLFSATTDDIEVEYTSRAQVDKLLERARMTGKLDMITFGQKRDPCESYFKKLKTSFLSASYKPTDPGLENVGVVIQQTPGDLSKNSLTISTDSSVLKKIDRDLLEPLGVTNQEPLHPELRGPISSAHPCIDPKTGDLFNFNLELGPKATYRIFKTTASTGETEILAKFAQKDIPAAYVHSFFMTENYVILCIWPSFFRNYGLSVLWEQNIIDALRFDAAAKTNWIVINKSGGGIVNRYTSEAIFAFHFVNGWEAANDQGGIDIVCDLVEYQDMSILKKLYYENLMSTGTGAKDWTNAAKPSQKWTLKRYCLPAIASEGISRNPLNFPDRAQVKRSIPSPDCGELPKINETHLTKRHRYVYGVAMRDLSSFYDCMVKTDMDADDSSPSCKIWESPKHTPGEPIFIPNPEGKAEDDGVLLSVVLNGETGTSYLLCLDASSMEEIARAEVDVAVGFGFHGVHLPSS